MPNRRNAFYFLVISCLILNYVTGRSFFLNLAYLFGALLIISGIWSWLSMHWLRITRQTRARRAQVGKALEEQFVVRNVGLLPKLWLELRDQSDIPGYSASFVVPFLWPFQTYRYTSRAICTVRGEYTLGPMTLISGDPFGLFQATRTISATSRILVYPAIAAVHTFATPVGMLSGGDSQRQRTHIVTTNAAGVRTYVPGDSFNRIHWKSVARHNELLVKEFDLDPLADVWMFLDLSLQSLFERPYTLDGGMFTETFIPPSSAEYAIVIAASLAQYYLTKERGLGFVMYDPQRVVMAADRGERQLSKILASLAMAKTQGSMTCSQMLALEGHALVRGTTVVIITADPTDAWLDEGALLLRRGMRLVAVILDPHTFGTTDVRSGEQTIRILENMGVTTYLVRQGDDIGAVLNRRRYSG